MVFGLSLLWVLFRRHRPAFLEAQRRRAAFARAKSALKSGTVTDLCLILREYLADRFNTRTESMTPADAQRLLIERGLPPSLAERFSTLMQHHFNAAFETTPANSPGSTMELESLLAEIERHLNAPGEKNSSIEILSLFFILLAALPATASTSAERTFIRDEAAAELGSAQSPKDFLMAAGTCQELVDLGIRNAPLFYNQGTALLMADKPSDAITVLLRAERYGGSTPDIRRNLAIAQAKKDGLKTPVVSWLRLILFWHYGLDCASRAVLAAAAFSGLWLAWALFILGARRTAKAMSTLCLILLVAWGSSVLATLQQESRIQRPLSTGTSNTQPVP
jgi:hypothetical protein